MRTLISTVITLYSKSVLNPDRHRRPSIGRRQIAQRKHSLLDAFSQLQIGADFGRKPPSHASQQLTTLSEAPALCLSRHFENLQSSSGPESLTRTRETPQPPTPPQLSALPLHHRARLSGRLCENCCSLLNPQGHLAYFCGACSASVVPRSLTDKELVWTDGSGSSEFDCREKLA